MLDTHQQYVIGKINEAWKHLARILDDDKISGNDAASILLTINTRYLNGFRKIPKEQRDILKQEYLDLLDEKLG